MLDISKKKFTNWVSGNEESSRFHSRNTVYIRFRWTIGIF
jgi:hypothetical protein